MTAISIQIEGQNGLTWPRWQRIGKAVEELGFAGLFRFWTTSPTCAHPTSIPWS